MFTTTCPIFFARHVTRGRRGEPCVDLAIGKMPHRLILLMHDPINVPPRIEPDVGNHAAEERVIRAADSVGRYSLALEIADCTDALGAK